jgi:hypothetical protein
MDQDRKDVRSAKAAPQEPVTTPAKKVYDRPQIVYRAPLEAMASVCIGENAKSPSEACTGLLFS